MGYVQSAQQGSSGAAVAATLPTAPTQGNLLVAWIAQQGSNDTWTPSPGWTLLTDTGASDTGAFAWKEATAGESATQQPVTAGNTARVWWVAVAEYEGIDFALMGGVWPVEAAGSNSPSPSVTPPVGVQALVVGAATSTSSGVTFTGQLVNGSATGVTDRQQGSSGSSSNATSADMWDADVTTAGSYSVDVTGSVGANGSAVAVFPYAAVVSTPAHGAVSGAQEWVGTATGHTGRHGAVDGAQSWTGAVTGHAPAVGAAHGSVSGSQQWAGDVAGHTDRSGLVAGGQAWHGAVVGHVERHGTAGGVQVWAGAVTGHTVRHGSAAGTVSWDAVVTGHAPSVASDRDWTGKFTASGVPDDYDAVVAPVVYDGAAVLDGYAATAGQDDYDAVAAPAAYSVVAVADAYTATATVDGYAGTAGQDDYTGSHDREA